MVLGTEGQDMAQNPCLSLLCFYFIFSPKQPPSIVLTQHNKLGEAWSYSSEYYMGLSVIWGRICQIHKLRPLTEQTKAAKGAVAHLLCLLMILL